uniref:Testin n=1 Tax=Glossina brevipalpis TaxID=37001 RepID=A0A1A9W3P9_9MUSC
MSNSCVETPDAPEWLSKLESRREQLKRSKLGHEAGAGAPCNDCGDKCPGLDLHFWRKVCRNCKCRKDQHMCTDDDLSGWAQFEILGQIRSKPAFIRIKALASQPVQLEWVPPNVTPDVAADYMEKLGTENVPVAGSEAATKRKQQLEFQVPPHDLDAALCDNLSESETNQMQQYVQKIRDSCVGQGNVIRVGNYGNALIGSIKHATDSELIRQAKYEEILSLLQKGPPHTEDHILSDLLTNEKLATALKQQHPCSYPKIFVAFSEPIADGSLGLKLKSKLAPATLNGLNESAIWSLVSNGPIYDKIFTKLKNNNFDITRDPRLGPLYDVRQEYLTNPSIKKELDNISSANEYKSSACSTPYTSPLKTPSKFLHDLSFNSPLPIKCPLQTRFGRDMLQMTPIRKVQFANSATTIQDCGLPTNVDYERDRFFAKILHSEPLKRALEYAKRDLKVETPLIALQHDSSKDLNDSNLSELTKSKLDKIQINSKDVLQSAVLNAPFYDRLFQALNDKNIKYSRCKVLQPLQYLIQELRNDKPFYEEVREYVTALPNSLEVAYAPVNVNLQKAMSTSKSTDSGFESKPSTPQHATNKFAPDDLHALVGKFTAIPGIEDMNMYPQVEPSQSQILSNKLQDLSLQDKLVAVPQQESETLKQLPFNCRDCSQTINFGEVAVKAARAGKEIAWHPECFKCHTCRELLADLVYFFHGGHVYCGRDLAVKLKIPRCKACDELIFTKEYTAAEGATFHIKHFCCFQCDHPLAGKQYVPDEKTNMPLCLKCYDEYYAAACQRCKLPIGPADQGVAWGQVHWHDSCFLCAGQNCGRSLIGGRFCVKQSMPFCSPTCVRSIMQ